MSKYDPANPTKYLTYLYANNSYGWAMTQFLPKGGLEWVDPEEIDNILEYTEDYKYWALVECDLEYSRERHVNHNDYTLAPENVEIDGVRQLVVKNIPYIFRTSNIISLRE